jgi:hypothetical protein
MNEKTFLWALPCLGAVVVAAQLYAGRIRLYRAPREWQRVDKTVDPGRFWLFIVAELLLIVILIGQAATT